MGHNPRSGGALGHNPRSGGALGHNPRSGGALGHNPRSRGALVPNISSGTKAIVAPYCLVKQSQMVVQFQRVLWHPIVLPRSLKG